MEQPIYGPAEISEFLGISKSQLNRLEADGGLPQPLMPRGKNDF